MQNVSVDQHALPVQRNQSPVDQIVEEVSYQCRGGVGTDSPGSTSGTSSSGSSGYPVRSLMNFVNFVKDTTLCLKKTSRL